MMRKKSKPQSKKFLSRRLSQRQFKASQAYAKEQASRKGAKALSLGPQPLRKPSKA